MPADDHVGSAMAKLTPILTVAGVVLVLAGLGLGFRGVSADSTDCGSVFVPAAGITPMACDGELSRSATLVTVVLVLGGLGLAGAFALKLLGARRNITA